MVRTGVSRPDVEEQELRIGGPGRADVRGRTDENRLDAAVTPVPEHRARAPRVRPVVLLGIDGAGKSTAAAALVAAEREAGRPASVLRNRSGRRWLARRSARLGLELPVRWTDRIESAVRTVHVLVAHVRARRREGLVVMDRHLVCQLVLRQARGLPPGRFLPWLAQRWLEPGTVIVLDVPAETAYARVMARGEDEESLEYLRTTRAAYLDLARARGWRIVDATATTGALADSLVDSLRHVTGD